MQILFNFFFIYPTFRVTAVQNLISLDRVNIRSQNNFVLHYFRPEINLKFLSNPEPDPKNPAQFLTLPFEINVIVLESFH